ncbi:hypothetical protein RRG08_025150 [Elysia crispata]|uniref:Uncharacterized protein n=1 Tax=Elysia crispata TaxID=231223 RepID=A0AAE0YAQ9_9GAST|nr:hypothetical protein RRG08_025150 [Elysia crispata]
MAEVTMITNRSPPSVLKRAWLGGVLLIPVYLRPDFDLDPIEYIARSGSQRVSVCNPLTTSYPHAFKYNSQKLLRSPRVSGLVKTIDLFSRVQTHYIDNSGGRDSKLVRSHRFPPCSIKPPLGRLADIQRPVACRVSVLTSVSVPQPLPPPPLPVLPQLATASGLGPFKQSDCMLRPGSELAMLQAFSYGTPKTYKGLAAQINEGTPRQK